ncbi:unnamed protein product [Clonostachys byssicola]|uniref:Zn(2)-C6 fungal-type domain-containing protein n=1 Tax=Clonostachys byssicola TaxID=160290 RepID=A0A9N9UMH7_9HYPO|nr:unnamed protein product [Clonostachys byssicola]
MSELPQRKAPSTAPRKWHTKSRTGCQACKARKVKCDEHHPSCRNCLKRNVKCDFLLGDDSSSSSSPPAAAPANLELELLHNWTVSTSTTFATEPQVRDLWRVLVPQIGFHTRYILDGILALSALHVARFDPARRDLLLAQATEYHTASLKGALPLIPTVTSQNCTNLFLFGVITLFTNLASPRREEDMLLVGNSGIPQWLFLLRGIDTLVAAEEQAILSSAVSLIFRSTAESAEFWCTHSPDENSVLAELQAGIRSRTASSGDKARRDTLLEAVETMKRSYTFLESNKFADDQKLRGFYNWLFMVSDDYLKLLKDGDVEALCVFAFYTVLIRDLEKYWWVEGWSIHLIKRIYYLLDEEYRLYIRWPIEQVGWVPQTRAR